MSGLVISKIITTITKSYHSNMKKRREEFGDTRDRVEDDDDDNDDPGSFEKASVVEMAARRIVKSR